MSEQWQDAINQEGAGDGFRNDSWQCDGCVGIKGAASDEWIDSRCDACKHPLSAISLWIESNRVIGGLHSNQVASLYEWLLPEIGSEKGPRTYMVEYRSKALGRLERVGPFMERQAQEWAKMIRGRIVEEGA